MRGSLTRPGFSHCWCCTTCARRSSLAGVTGPSGGSARITGSAHPAHRDRARECTPEVGQGSDPNFGIRATPCGRRGEATSRRPTNPTSCHCRQERLGVGQGTVRLARVRQPTRRGRLRGSGTDTLLQRRQRPRAGHQQGRKPTCSSTAGRAELGLAEIAAGQCIDLVVQQAIRRWRQAHATRGHRRTGQAPGHCSMEVSEAR